MNKRSILTVSLAAAVIFGFSLAGLIKTPQTYSLAERRILSQPPELSAQSLGSGEYMAQFEEYSLDRFPLRDRFRTLKALSSLYLFRQRDNNGIYEAEGYYSKLDYPLNEELLGRSARKITDVYEKYVSGTDCTAYLSIIPDKNYFLAQRNGFPAIDYPLLVREAGERLAFADYIDIFGTLSIEAYYRTDTHWRQEKITGTAQTLADAMGADIAAEYGERTLDVPFYGVYAGQSALHLEPETISYLDNETLETCIVTSFDSGKPVKGSIYDFNKARGKDAYEFFLGGSDALLTIENPNAAERRELVVFRDSFGSSLIPLLVPGYSKITAVDLRYIRADLLGEYITFDKQDVLFLYSTLALNSGI